MVIHDERPSARKGFAPLFGFPGGELPGFDAVFSRIVIEPAKAEDGHSATAAVHHASAGQPVGAHGGCNVAAATTAARGALAGLKVVDLARLGCDGRNHRGFLFHSSGVHGRDVVFNAQVAFSWVNGNREVRIAVIGPNPRAIDPITCKPCVIDNHDLRLSGWRWSGRGLILFGFDIEFDAIVTTGVGQNRFGPSLNRKDKSAAENKKSVCRFHANYSSVCKRARNPTIGEYILEDILTVGLVTKFGSRGNIRVRFGI